MQRTIQETVQDIPKKIVSCRDQLEYKIHEDMKENYVTKQTFNAFSHKITYTLSGIVLVGIFVTWFLSAFVNIAKILGH